MNIKNQLEGYDKLDSLVSAYYENYYKNQLGLPDWQDRVGLRLNEEDNYCSRFIDWIEEWINYNFSGKKVLVIGCGTGGEVVNFHKKGADVFGIEPNEDGLKICYLKAKMNGIPEENIIQGYSEQLPYNDEEFDFIYCFTVLEHVQDIDKSIYEMVRCVKNKGKIFIETPDYRQLYEGHYKIPLPMFLPVWTNKIILKIIGRPTDYIESINKVNSRQLYNIFKTHPITAIRIFRGNQNKAPKIKFKFSYIVTVIQYIIEKYFSISINQIWILHKDVTT